MAENINNKTLSESIKKMDENDRWWDTVSLEEKEKFIGYYVLVHEQEIKYKSRDFKEVDKRAARLPSATVYGVETEEESVTLRPRYKIVSK